MVPIWKRCRNRSVKSRIPDARHRCSILPKSLQIQHFQQPCGISDLETTRARTGRGRRPSPDRARPGAATPRHGYAIFHFVSPCPGRIQKVSRKGHLRPWGRSVSGEAPKGAGRLGHVVRWVFCGSAPAPGHCSPGAPTVMAARLSFLSSLPDGSVEDGLPQRGAIPCCAGLLARRGHRDCGPVTASRFDKDAAPERSARQE